MTLDELADTDPKTVIALMLWKERLRQPDLYVTLSDKEIAGLEDCARYLKVRPEVRIFRPQGVPAQPAIAAGPGRRAVPAREAGEPKSYVMVQLVDDKGDAFRPIENNEQDFDAAEQASRVRKARDSAQMLANRLVEQARTGEFSLSDMTDAANALLVLAAAV